jgi:hypothetical protein
MKLKSTLILLSLVACAEDGKDGQDGINGVNGINGQPCIALKNQDESYTITCPNSEPIIIRNAKDGMDGINGTNGQDGMNGMNGTNGRDGQDGQDGQDGASCATTTNTDGSYTVTCPNAEPIVIRDGQDGESCRLAMNTDGSYTLTCPNSPPITLNQNTAVSGQACAMPTHNGQMSISLEGQCLATGSCAGGVSYLGDAQCGSEMICCVSNEQIDVVQAQTLRVNGDPSLCSQNEGFCVDINENNCEVEAYVLQTGLCPGSNQILCCKAM